MPCWRRAHDTEFIGVQFHKQIEIKTSNISNISLFQIKVLPTNNICNKVPSVCGGLHDEVQVVSALPPAAGVGEVHLLSVLSHRQVVDERQLPASDHLTTRH